MRNTLKSYSSSERSKSRRINIILDFARTIFIAASVFIASCGGGGTKTANITLQSTLPSSMSTLSANMTVMGMIYSSTDADAEVVAQPTAGTKDENGNYAFELKATSSVSPGNVFRAEFYYNSVLIAYTFHTLASGDGETVTAAEADFITTQDNDADGMANLFEILLGLDVNNPDTDGDGVPDGVDVFPSVSAEWADLDGDGIGDNSDDDIDGDGLSNSDELLYGTDPKLVDTDGDGALDADDNCKVVSNADQKDTDSDGKGDACVDDADGDGLSDAEEATRGTNKLLVDTDGDGLGDGTEVSLGTNPLSPDTDSDGRNDGSDNCPTVPNVDQQDSDVDGIGDVCDADEDNDGVLNSSDNCQLVVNADQADMDSDGVGDACDNDVDGDLVLNGSDNCPYVSNPLQLAADVDNDTVKVECDLDETDANVGAKESAVFVDVAHGSDTNGGNLAAPLASISAAITKAKAQGKNIYVAAGTYNVANVVWQGGIGLFGGFRNSVNPADRFTSRNVESTDPSYKTVFTRSTADVTIYTSGITGLIIGGFHIENTSTTISDLIEGSRTIEISGGAVTFDRNTIVGNINATRSTAVKAVSGANVTLTRNLIDGGGKADVESTTLGILFNSASGKVTNNIIKAGNGRHVTGVELSSSSPIIVNNTIDARSLNSIPRIAEGLIFTSSSPVVVNNLIFTGNALEDQYPLQCYGTASTLSAKFKNNLLAIFGGPSPELYARDCNGVMHEDAIFTMGAAEVSANVTYNATEDVSNLIDPTTYGLIGSGINAGLNTNDPSLGGVVNDYHGTVRLLGAYDIGAVEHL